MSSRPDNFFYGTSGIVMPMPRSAYPPEFQQRTRLEYFASLFNSLEVNSSFYKNPQASTVAKWTAMVPDDFRFTFKLSKVITHNKGLIFDEDLFAPFFKTISPAASKKGCLLIQFPPSLTIDNINGLQTLLGAVSHFNEEEWKPAVEFRHASWYERETYELLEEFDATMVLHDIPSSAPPADELLGDTAYLRFHGPEPRYRGSYSGVFLADQAQRINDLRAAGKTVYCYFNNTAGDAVNNLQTLLTL